MAAKVFGLVHVCWETDNDCVRLEGSQETMQAKADELNSEWPKERWFATQAAGPESPPPPDPAAELLIGLLREVSYVSKGPYHRDALEWLKRQGLTT